jgi:galacturonosyltransferase
MKKILIITNHSYMLYRFRLELIQELMKNHEVVLCMPFVGHEDDFQAMGLKCIETDLERRSMNPVKELGLLFTYRKILKQERPDMVITYSIKPNIYAGLACAMAGIPYHCNVQGLGTAFQRKGLAAFGTMLYKSALRKAGTVFFENEGNAQEFLDRNIIPKERITLLPGAGINLKAYAKKPYPDNEAVRFLYLGRIMKEKGIDELFSAMRRLHSELGNRVALDIVGFFDDEYYKEQVDQLVADGIAVFHGFQTEPRPYYEAADCVVLASYHEGMSNVLLEAAATGRPVITSNIHGCKEAVDADVTGLLCNVKDADSLYEQMLRVAQMPKAQRQSMGNAGRAKMEREFEKSVVVQKTVDAIFETARM